MHTFSYDDAVAATIFFVLHTLVLIVGFFVVRADWNLRRITVGRNNTQELDFMLDVVYLIVGLMIGTIDVYSIWTLYWFYISPLL